jgi:uncharacterized protein YjbI with pentapeptide repeats
MTKYTLFVEITHDEYLKLCEIIPTLHTRSHVKTLKINNINRVFTSKSNIVKPSARYEVSDKSILNQYRIDCSYNLSYSEIRQLTKLHKGLLEQKLNGYSIIKYFSFADVDLSNRDLSNIKLREGNLSGGNFKNSNLSNCDLSKTNLRGVDFTGANLENAKFDIARLGKYQGKDTIFTGANLKGTILENN